MHLQTVLICNADNGDTPLSESSLIDNIADVAPLLRLFSLYSNFLKGFLNNSFILMPHHHLFIKTCFFHVFVKIKEGLYEKESFCFIFTDFWSCVSGLLLRRNCDYPGHDRVYPPGLAIALHGFYVVICITFNGDIVN